MSRFRLVFLDVDGVITNSFDGILAATNQLLRENGGRLVGAEEFRDHLHLDWENFMANWGMNYQPEIHDDILEGYFFDQLPHETFPGTREILELIKDAGLPIHLISACTVELTKCKMHDGQLLHLIDSIHGSEKKHLIIKGICQQYRVNPSECLFITDMSRDLACGKKAGIGHMVGIVSQFSTPESLSPHCDKLVHDHQELLSHLVEILV